MQEVTVGSKVQWSTGRKPLGTVIHIFKHRGQMYAVVENEKWNLKVVKIYDKLVVVG